MRLPRTLAILLIVVSIFALSRGLLTGKNEPSIFDVPKKLEPAKLTLKVWPYSQHQEVAVFSTSKSAGEEDRIYLEPATPFLDIKPSEFRKLQDSGFVLKIFGSFYKGKGIPARFLNTRPTPERYPVFRYESLDLVK